MLDFTKPVQTRDGREVVILSTEAPGICPIVGYLKGEMTLRRWCRGGSYVVDAYAEHPMDLIQVPQPFKVIRYINVYSVTSPCVSVVSSHATRQIADDRAGADRIACVRVEVDAVEGRFDA
ncbi:hypothetical protein [Nitrospirillum iridis]|uniref:Uncharacterized protein n=1 Tax=Nitrospirillum iridis TaxID=765888 RepID=A0A7X0B0E6_9PROT|nr:hypothetical protein [Nitrospirillum iridis]MBB6253037.1 hypothetical protein [Nitrospirillum iridis]